MRTISAIIAIGAALLATSPALARGHHHGAVHHHFSYRSANYRAHRERAAGRVVVMTNEGRYAYGSLPGQSYEDGTWSKEAPGQFDLGYRVRRFVRHVISGACAVAARQGGPCGCFAEGIIFGTHEHVLHGWNAWLARAWYRFPRTTAHEGAVAVRRHHVVVMGAVDAAHNRFLARDSWGTHWRSLSGWTFVQPRG